MSESMSGHVAGVARELRGDQLSAPAGVGATSLHVYDVADFDETGGFLRLTSEDGATVETVLYVTVDDDASTITLDTGLVNAFPADVRADVINDAGDEVPVWYASVVDDVDDSTFSAPLSHTLVDLVESGMRLTGESVSVRRDADGEWWVTEVVGKEPAINGAFLGDDTITETKIAPDSIQTPHLEANAITSKHTITGAAFRTAATGQRWEIDSPAASNEIRAYSEVVGEVGPAILRSTVEDEYFGVLNIYSPAAGMGGRSFLALSSTADTTGPATEGIATNDAALVADAVKIQGSKAGFSGRGGVNGGVWIVAFEGSTIDLQADASQGGRVRIINAPTTGNAANVHMGAGGGLHKVSSSRRWKVNERPLADAAAYLALEPKLFNSTLDADDPATDMVGFIAEDADSLGLTEWVEYDENGDPSSFAYPAWTAALQAICRHQADQISALEARVAALEGGTIR